MRKYTGLWEGKGTQASTDDLMLSPSWLYVQDSLYKEMWGFIAAKYHITPSRPWHFADILGFGVLDLIIKFSFFFIDSNYEINKHIRAIRIVRDFWTGKWKLSSQMWLSHETPGFHWSHYLADNSIVYMDRTWLPRMLLGLSTVKCGLIWPVS